jgi:hypothetical protein
MCFYLLAGSRLHAKVRSIGRFKRVVGWSAILFITGHFTNGQQTQELFAVVLPREQSGAQPAELL